MITATARTLIFFVPGKPIAQGSKRPFRNKHTGRINLTEQLTELGPWRERVAIAAHNAMGGRKLFPGPITLTASFVLPRPKSTPKRITPAAIKQPDWDKLGRAVSDALTGTVYNDDAQVIDGRVRKRLAEIGETPGAHIRVEAQ